MYLDSRKNSLEAVDLVAVAVGIVVVHVAVVVVGWSVGLCWPSGPSEMSDCRAM